MFTEGNILKPKYSLNYQERMLVIDNYEKVAYHLNYYFLLLAKNSNENILNFIIAFNKKRSSVCLKTITKEIDFNNSVGWFSDKTILREIDFYMNCYNDIYASLNMSSYSFALCNLNYTSNIENEQILKEENDLFYSDYKKISI